MKEYESGLRNDPTVALFKKSMVKIYNNISITPPRRRAKGRLCSYIMHMLLHLILMLGWYQTGITRAYRKLAISPTSNLSRQQRSNDLRSLLVSPIKSQTSCFKHDLIA